MKSNSTLKIALGVVVLIILAVGATVWDIAKSVDENIEIAQKAHPAEADDVASLIAYVNSPKHTLIEKNHAVWTLGRIGDERAVAALKPHFTGIKCFHVEELCQKELKRAIKRCRR
jgi:hypothetical protein